MFDITSERPSRVVTLENDEEEKAGPRVQTDEVQPFQVMKRRRVLGYGTYGTVFLVLAKSKSKGRELVAVKVLNPNKMDHGCLRLFLAEIRLLSRLRHPAIVTFRDFVSLSALTHVDPFVTVESLAHKRVALVQEYMPGGTLRDAIHRKMSQPSAYGWADVFRWFLGLAQGMAYLHAQSPAIVHRDFKPENILLTTTNLRRAEAKIADFGLAKAIKRCVVEPGPEAVSTLRRAGPDRHRTSTRAEHSIQSSSRSQSPCARSPRILKSLEMPDQYIAVDATGLTGSRLYMAPEVFKQQRYNESVDVFAFGVVLFEALTGQLKSLSFVTGMQWEADMYAREVADGYRNPIPWSWPDEVKARGLAERSAKRPTLLHSTGSCLCDTAPADAPSGAVGPRPVRAASDVLRCRLLGGDHRQGHPGALRRRTAARLLVLSFC